jgi:erythromycin esterase-like protein
MKKLRAVLLLSRLLALAALTVAGGSPAGAVTASASASGNEHGQALAAAAKDLCPRQLVLLGENGFHGDGETIAFKARLIETLVRRCGFKAVFFEGSAYDFAAFERSVRHGEPTSADMVASSIGAKWSVDREMAQLIPFLYEKARAKRITLGGLDEQIGALNAYYSLDAFPAELGRRIGGTAGAECGAQLRRRIWVRYTKEAPYSPQVRDKVLACLKQARQAVDSAGLSRDDRADLLFMIWNFEDVVVHDTLDPPERSVRRDFVMYRNLRALEARLPPGTKTIVWAANAHVGKDPSGNPAFPRARRNFGSFVEEGFGDRAFVLGFTAASGSFRWDRKTVRPVAQAQPDSLEAVALARPGAAASVYLGPASLAKLGTVVASAYDDHKPATARWSDVYDGLVVFRAERPTELLNP